MSFKTGTETVLTEVKEYVNKVVEGIPKVVGPQGPKGDPGPAGKNAAPVDVESIKKEILIKVDEKIVELKKELAKPEKD